MDGLDLVDSTGIQPIWNKLHCLDFQELGTLVFEFGTFVFGRELFSLLRCMCA